MKYWIKSFLVFSSTAVNLGVDVGVERGKKKPDVQTKGFLIITFHPLHSLKVSILIKLSELVLHYIKKLPFD